jgi:hypothetical protein
MVLRRHRRGSSWGTPGFYAGRSPSDEAGAGHGLPWPVRANEGQGARDGADRHGGHLDHRARGRPQTDSAELIREGRGGVATDTRAALALARGTVVVTADRRFRRAVGAHPSPAPRVMHLDEVAEA